VTKVVGVERIAFRAPSPTYNEAAIIRTINFSTSLCKTLRVFLMAVVPDQTVVIAKSLGVKQSFLS
jgi:hypothetical protein